MYLHCLVCPCVYILSQSHESRRRGWIGYCIIPLPIIARSLMTRLPCNASSSVKGNSFKVGERRDQRRDRFPAGSMSFQKIKEQYLTKIKREACLNQKNSTEKCGSCGGSSKHMWWWLRSKRKSLATTVEISDISINFVDLHTYRQKGRQMNTGK